ncbi:MAG: ABC transporter permease [Desulfobacterales bacterium]|nr:ABC transporter permease [Desulfobacterales bacterium]
MILKQNIIEAVNSLVSAKQRSVLALIGIVVGIGSVIAMVSVGTIVKQEALRQFMEMGTDVVTIRKAGSDNRPGRQRQLTLAVADNIPSACPAVLEVAPYMSENQILKFRGTKVSVSALGVTPAFERINKLRLKEGRFIHGLDRNMFYCLIGHRVETILRKAGVAEPLGARILFKEKYLTVIGVIDKVPMGGMRPYEINEGIILPISTLQRMFREAEIRHIMARSDGASPHNTIERQVNAYLASRDSIKANVRSAEQLIAQMETQMQLFTLLLGAIGSISLVVGGIGVMNVMLVSVTERTREIGIRRALGARRGDILVQFLIESVLLCILGGLLGIGTGVAASWLIAHYAQWQFSVSYDAMVLGVGVAVAVGVFFGIYPARQAARLSPILALRSD